MKILSVALKITLLAHIWDMSNFILDQTLALAGISVDVFTRFRQRP